MNRGARKGITQVNPAARVGRSTTQSIPNSAFTSITFDLVKYDTTGMWGRNTFADRLIVSRAGVYSLSGNVVFAANATGVRGIAFLISGTTYVAAHIVTNIGAGTGNHLSIAQDVYLQPNDYIQLQVFQTSGGALSTQLLPDYSMFLTARMAVKS